MPIFAHYENIFPTIEKNSLLYEFIGTLEFVLDSFQIEACKALELDKNVLVSAPTGSGKTVVADFALFLSQKKGVKVFYTTPIKALSNQKYNDFVAKYGSENVGLLTGDTVVNGEAAIVVMTTEILRNMLYASSVTLNNLVYVIMDEVHYLADKFRGGVWEEVIVHLPEHICLVSLSATVSNAAEFGSWIDVVRGETEVVVSDVRPVSLVQHVFLGNKLWKLYANKPVSKVRGNKFNLNPELSSEVRRQESLNFSNKFVQRRGRKYNHVSRQQLVKVLAKEHMLPVIVFIFSRNACDAAVSQCVSSGFSLNDENKSSQVLKIVNERCANIPVEDLEILNFRRWSYALSKGVAAHHAGLLPTFKAIVEELFLKGLVQVVFATETLALGINMPARTVLIEKLEKYNGQQHVSLSSGEYTQLTGRAGRRGIDTVGHAVVNWQVGSMDLEDVASLASKKSYPLNSNFLPSYNMAVNLISQFGVVRSENILESSFAQFQTDKAVVILRKTLNKNKVFLSEYFQKMSCHLGDFVAYSELVKQFEQLKKQVSKDRKNLQDVEIVEGLKVLQIGDIISVPKGKYRGFAVVVGRGFVKDYFTCVVVTLDKKLAYLSVADFLVPPVSLGKIVIAEDADPKLLKVRRNIAGNLRYKVGLENIQVVSVKKPRAKFIANGLDLDSLRKEILQHPCNGCVDKQQHYLGQKNWEKLEEENRQILLRIESRTNNIVNIFTKICKILSYFGYLEIGVKSEENLVASRELVLTDSGKFLRRVYGDKDLLVALCVADKIWESLNAVEFSAVFSTLVYESKRDILGSMQFANFRVKLAFEETLRVWLRLSDIEKKFDLSVTEKPDFGLAYAVYSWAEGNNLNVVLENADFSAGDFVRWVKQIIDLMTQLANAAGADDLYIKQLASNSVSLLKRGVVAYSSTM